MDLTAPLDRLDAIVAQLAAAPKEAEDAARSYAARCAYTDYDPTMPYLAGALQGAVEFAVLDLRRAAAAIRAEAATTRVPVADLGPI